MYLWQRKSNIGLGIAAKLHQFLHRTGIIEVGKSCRVEFSFDFNAWLLVQVIVATKIVFVQQQVHLFASLAAEIPVVHTNTIIATFAAMITVILYGGILVNKLFF